jgi:hypothetical protein
MKRAVGETAGFSSRILPVVVPVRDAIASIVSPALTT